MTQRKSLSKKVRFEVFKRDSFTCQFCGAKAPDVILEVDHIKPVKEGGVNDLLNLVTSCFECNRGKGCRELNDSTIVEKQRAQIEQLNIRRQQLEMMLAWREGLNSLQEDIAKAAIDNFNSKFHYTSFNELGQKNMTKLVRKFGLYKVLEQTDIIFDKYAKCCNTKEEESNLFEELFNKLGSFLNFNSMPAHKQKIAFLKGILKNRISYFNEKKYHIVINDICKEYGEECLDILIERSKTYTGFRNSFLEEQLINLIHEA